MDLNTAEAKIWRLAPLLLVLTAAGCAVGAYLQVLYAPFIYDDSLYIVHNSKLAELHQNELWRLFFEVYNQFSEFLPLRDLSFWFDIKLFGQTPSAFRLHNIFLYLLCLFLVFSATRSVWRYFRPEDTASAPWVAATVTVLFALHPSHAEAVVWISGRKDVLSGMFSLLALCLALRVKQKQAFALPYVVAALLALLAAMLSKATAVAVAPVIAMLWLLFWLDVPPQNRRWYFLLWPFASMVLAGGATLIFASTVTSKVPVYLGIEAAIRTLAVQGWLARLAFSAESRHFFYPLFEDPFLPVMVILGIAVLAAAVIGAAAVLRKRSLAGFAVVTFFLICIPSIQLIPYNPPSLVSDRFIFLAVWPAMLLVAMLSWKLRPLPRVIVLFVIAAAFCYQTVERARDWRSMEVVIDADIQAYPGYYMPAFQKIIWVQVPQGLYPGAGETASRISDPEIRNIMIGLIATQYLLRAEAEASEDHRPAMRLLWKLWFTIEKQPAQLKWNTPMSHIWKFCRNALATQWDALAKRFPDDALLRYNAGTYMLKIPPYEEDAAVHLRAATESQQLPQVLRSTAFVNLGIALMKSGRATEAEVPLRAALSQSAPDRQAYCLLAEMYRKTMRNVEAKLAQASCPRSQVK